MTNSSQIITRIKEKEQTLFANNDDNFDDQVQKLMMLPNGCMKMIIEPTDEQDARWNGGRSDQPNHREKKKPNTRRLFIALLGKIGSLFCSCSAILTLQL